MPNLHNDKICSCFCHQKGSIVKHIMACCKLTYVKYINPDGSYDQEVIQNTLKEKKD